VKTADIQIGKTYLVSSRRDRIYDDRSIVRVLATGVERPNLDGFGTSSDGVLIEKVDFEEPREREVRIDAQEVRTATFRRIRDGEERQIGEHRFGGFRNIGADWEEKDVTTRLMVRPQQVKEPMTPEEFSSLLREEKVALDARAVEAQRREEDRIARMGKIQAALAERDLPDLIPQRVENDLILGPASYRSGGISISLVSLGKILGFEMPRGMGKMMVKDVTLEDLEALLGLET
jgi:hypothetical protein